MSRTARALACCLLTVALAAASHAAAPLPVANDRALVVSPHPAVTAAGVEILNAGGNAVDAAIAAAFALAVAQPQSTGIGGGGFLLIRLADGRAFAIDARETAPAAATPDLYTRPGVPENASLVGGLAVGTPGLVAGLALALEAHGTLPLARVLAPRDPARRGGLRRRRLPGAHRRGDGQTGRRSALPRARAHPLPARPGDGAHADRADRAGPHAARDRGARAARVLRGPRRRRPSRRP